MLQQPSGQLLGRPWAPGSVWMSTDPESSRHVSPRQLGRLCVRPDWSSGDGPHGDQIHHWELWTSVIDTAFELDPSLLWAKEIFTHTPGPWTVILPMPQFHHVMGGEIKFGRLKGIRLILSECNCNGCWLLQPISVYPGRAHHTTTRGGVTDCYSPVS